ncbi:hypothetical protein CEXT_528701 [Caerostris extrusa]|uniref:Secreted protein n=1 Tax=Caerostris extrusa TaxID=172846 RepID=A0AAV4N8Z2_CAEEX|nr:hypothetical protein CEXT_528701 [Caerostris extrusa]
MLSSRIFPCLFTLWVSSPLKSMCPLHHPPGSAARSLPMYILSSPPNIVLACDISISKRKSCFGWEFSGSLLPTEQLLPEVNVPHQWVLARSLSIYPFPQKIVLVWYGVW